MGCNESTEQVMPLTKPKDIDIKSLARNAGGIENGPRLITQDVKVEDMNLEPLEKQEPEEEKGQEEQDYEFESPDRPS